MDNNTHPNNTCKSIFKSGDSISKDTFTSKMIELINCSEKSKATTPSLPKESKP